MSFEETDKRAEKLIAAANKDSAAHGARNCGDILDTVPLEYFDVKQVAEAYLAMRRHSKQIKAVVKAIHEAGAEIEWYDLHE